MGAHGEWLTFINEDFIWFLYVTSLINLRAYTIIHLYIYKYGRCWSHHQLAWTFDLTGSMDWIAYNYLFHTYNKLWKNCGRCWSGPQPPTCLDRWPCWQSTACCTAVIVSAGIFLCSRHYCTYFLHYTSVCYTAQFYYPVFSRLICDKGEQHAP